MPKFKLIESTGIPYEMWSPVCGPGCNILGDCGRLFFHLTPLSGAFGFWKCHNLLARITVASISGYHFVCKTFCLYFLNIILLVNELWLSIFYIICYWCWKCLCRLISKLIQQLLIEYLLCIGTILCAGNTE